MDDGIEDVGAGLPARLARLLAGSEMTVATAESVTAGHIATELAAGPASGDWFRGGIVAYGTPVKQAVLGVEPGPVMNARTARQMAVGAARLLGADFTVATTGVGGPDPEEGVDPGTVFIAVDGPQRTEVHQFRFAGDPSQVVDCAAKQAIRELLKVVQRVKTERATEWDGNATAIIAGT